MFKYALKRVLKYEGGYVDDKDDRGGETFKGISRKFHPDWKGWQIIDRLKFQKRELKSDELESLVYDFYLGLWFKSAADTIDRISPKLAAEYFDAVVNMGEKEAVLILQRVINIYSDKKIKVDGILGPKTLEALEDLVSLDEDLAMAFKNYRVRAYADIVKNNPKYLKYISGWIDRALNIA